MHTTHERRFIHSTLVPKSRGHYYRTVCDESTNEGGHHDPNDCEESGMHILRPLPIAMALLVSSLSHAIPRTAERSVAITHCSVFDPETERMLPDRTIVIEGDRIVAVAGPGTNFSIAADADRIDGRGKFAVPGLIDAHVHLVHVSNFARVTGDELLPLYLAAGVTSVRSTGDEIVAGTLVARCAERHPESSPRVFTCSPLLDGDPPIHRDVGRAVTDPAQVPSIIEDLARWKIATIKIYAGTRRDVGRAIIEEGHRHGLPVTAHLGAYSAQDAVVDGVDCLEHVWSVFNYVIPSDVARTPGYRGRLDLNNPLCESLVAELARRSTFVDPTLAVFRNMILLSDVAEIRDHPDNALAPKRLRDYWPTHLAGSGCPQGGPLEDRRREFAKFQELTGKMYRAGVPLLAGTDAPEPQVTPGFSLHQELEMLVESGLPPAAALRCATLHNARALKRDHQIGTIAPGKWADIVLLAANPLDDIRHTRKIELVIRGGRIVQPADVLKMAPRE
jgi:imidazolonepropionase-like amidohydrolase